jgi:phosphopantothenoylcysteine decarboxylase/phosphopantothenate--cysteine ligase
MKHKKLNLLLGISGGISAYKLPLLIRLLKKHNIDIKVVLTRAAMSLVGVEAIRAVSQGPVYLDDNNTAYDMDHIRLAQWADLYFICPTTANTIAKIAHGIADNLLTTLVLSFNGITTVAPAMNTAMWQNAATCDNIEILKKRGVRVLPVVSGPLACGEDGAGRMLSIDTIAEYILGAQLPHCFYGKKILIASGPTVEPIDPVRIITNRSSGKMGAALANAALCMGADVTVITGPSQIPLPEGIRVENVSTSKEMSDALKSHFNKTDVCIMAAAIGDFRPLNFSKEKIKKDGRKSLSIELKPNQDIAAMLAKKRKKQFLACFSLETDGGEKRAEEKMNKKGCDMMIYNSVDSSLGTDKTKISILYPGQPTKKMDTMDKRESARSILLAIAEKLGLFNG